MELFCVTLLVTAAVAAAQEQGALGFGSPSESYSKNNHGQQVFSQSLGSSDKTKRESNSDLTDTIFSVQNIGSEKLADQGSSGEFLNAQAPAQTFISSSSQSVSSSDFISGPNLAGGASNAVLDSGAFATRLLDSDQVSNGDQGQEITKTFSQAFSDTDLVFNQNSKDGLDSEAFVNSEVVDNNKFLDSRSFTGDANTQITTTEVLGDVIAVQDSANIEINQGLRSNQDGFVDSNNQPISDLITGVSSNEVFNVNTVNLQGSSVSGNSRALIGVQGSARLVGRPQVRIISQKFTRDPNSLSTGAYEFSYEQDDGNKAEQRGNVQPGPEPETGVLTQEGSFTFTGDDGNTYTVTYVANDGGFQPQGAHLPVAPAQIPEYAQLRSEHPELFWAENGGAGSIQNDLQLVNNQPFIDNQQIVDGEQFVDPQQFVDDQQFEDPQQFPDAQQFVDDQQFVDNQQFVDPQQFLDNQKLVDNQKFVDK